MNECIVCGASVHWMENSEPFVVCAKPECQQVAVAAVRDGQTARQEPPMKQVITETEDMRTRALRDMDHQEFERLSPEEKKRFFAELEKESAELLAMKADLLKQVRSQRAQLKSMQVDVSNAARKYCQACGLSDDQTDDLLSIIRKSTGGLPELRHIFESAIPCSEKTNQSESCFAAILAAAGRGAAWSELMGDE